MDAKLDEDGDLIWLETNPQGAFLFIEALADVALTDALCELLIERASAAPVMSAPARINRIA
jgi:hypothetical protein